LNSVAVDRKLRIMTLMPSIIFRSMNMTKIKPQKEQTLLLYAPQVSTSNLKKNLKRLRLLNKMGEIFKIKNKMR
jgi:hypothetical protein